MPESTSDPNDGRDKSSKRNLPSWMSSGNSGSNSGKKKHVGTHGDSTKQIKEGGDFRLHENTPKKLDFSKLLDGVIFVLSGFVNPERSTLRSQALDMGAEYRPDWTSDCTLLVCAFANTPKFRQVESDNGTIVSKEWISECYNQRKLVEIERYLMHAGKPWRKNREQVEPNQDQMNMPPKEHQKQVVKTIMSGATEVGLPDTVKKQFSPLKIKEWAMGDLRQTVSWLESQEEKPEPSERKAIAAEGIITCLQDAIESLEQNLDVKRVTEQWKFVPRVVNELAQLEGGRKKGPLSKEQISQLAISCKKIYQVEFDQVGNSPKKGQKHASDTRKEEGAKINSEDAQYDSDETIEMTEEEIDLAYRKLPEICG